MSHEQSGRPPERPDEPADGRSRVDHPDTTPAEERGERLDTGKAIARGGKEAGHVPGAEPPPDAGRR